MSRNSVVLEKAASEECFAPHAAYAAPDIPARPSEYMELIRRLFHAPSTVAIVGSGAAFSARGVCETIAAELAAAGRRVVVVPVEKLLQMNPITAPDEKAFMPGKARNVWVWPAPLGQQIEFFKSRKSAGAGSWLDSLRENFDSVLLACGSVEPGTAELAAMADATVLAVEAGRTPKQQIERDRRSLQLRGAKLAGCILIRGK